MPQKNSMSKRIAAYIAGILSLGGVYFLLIVPCGYLLDYLSENTNPLRHEYIQGMILSGFISAAFWLPVAILLLYAKNIVHRKIFLIGVAPIIILGVVFLAMNGYVIALYIIEKMA